MESRREFIIVDQLQLGPAFWVFENIEILKKSENYLISHKYNRYSGLGPISLVLLEAKDKGRFQGNGVRSEERKSSNRHSLFYGKFSNDLVKYFFSFCIFFMCSNFHYSYTKYTYIYNHIYGCLFTYLGRCHWWQRHYPKIKILPANSLIYVIQDQNLLVSTTLSSLINWKQCWNWVDRSSVYRLPVPFLPIIIFLTVVVLIKFRIRFDHPLHAFFFFSFTYINF